MYTNTYTQTYVYIFGHMYFQNIFKAVILTIFFFYHQYVVGNAKCSQQAAYFVFLYLDEMPSD